MRPDLFTTRRGELRERITIQEPLYGGTNTEEIVSWTTFAAARPAAVHPARGRETVEGMRQTSEQMATVAIDYLAGVTTKMRVVHGSDTYDIRAVADVESRRRRMELICRQVL